jgi:SAM-dependent methyltransferase
LSTNTTDEAWQAWGQQDPYFGVLTDPRFRRANLTQETKQEFFESGRVHVEAVFAVIRTFVTPAFTTKRVLDFGCGVGRLVIPFARVADEVVGVDVSDGMLAEASKNCVEAGVKNVRFVKSDDTLSGLQGSFDLLHSCLVFQHIPVARGRELLRNMLTHLEPGGIGMVDFVYGKAYFAESFGVPPATFPKDENDESPSGDPHMQMNAYNMSEILFLLKEVGIERFHAQFMDHGPEYAALLFFQKPLVPQASLAAANE